MATETGKRSKGLTPAQIRAHKKYMEKFVELKVRMTPEKRAIIQAHARDRGESATTFVLRAIDNQLELDNFTSSQDETK